MLYRIQRFGIRQTSKIAGIVYFVLGIVLIPFFYIAMSAQPASADASRPEAFSPLTLWMLPALYGIIGYAMTALILYIYNSIAKNVGGVELDIVYATEPPPDHPGAGQNPDTSAMR